MATARIRFRAGDTLGWIDFDDATSALDVDHPVADVCAAVHAHFEARTIFITPVAQPPDLIDDQGRGVEDYCDEVPGTGLDSMDFFLRRASELAGGLCLRWRDALVLWNESTVPEDD